MNTFGAKVLAFSVICFLMALSMPFIYVWLREHLPEAYTTPMNGASGASAIEVPCVILGVVLGFASILGVLGSLTQDDWWKEEDNQ